jgi:ribosome biogenesis GTPase
MDLKRVSRKSMSFRMPADADCTHTDEPGCAVLEAARQDEISEARCQSYLKLSKENEVHDMSYVEKRRKDKDFGRFIKAHKKGGER